MELEGGHGSHIDLLDIACWGIVTVIPAEHFAIIGRGDKFTSLFVETDCVHGSFVVVIGHCTLHGDKVSIHKNNYRFDIKFSKANKHNETTMMMISYMILQSVHILPYSINYLPHLFEYQTDEYTNPHRGQ